MTLFLEFMAWLCMLWSVVSFLVCVLQTFAGNKLTTSAEISCCFWAGAAALFFIAARMPA